MTKYFKIETYKGKFLVTKRVRFLFWHKWVFYGSFDKLSHAYLSIKVSCEYYKSSYNIQLPGCYGK